MVYIVWVFETWGHIFHFLLARCEKLSWATLVKPRLSISQPKLLGKAKELHSSWIFNPHLQLTAHLYIYVCTYINATVNGLTIIKTNMRRNSTYETAHSRMSVTSVWSCPGSYIIFTPAQHRDMRIKITNYLGREFSTRCYPGMKLCWVKTESILIFEAISKAKLFRWRCINSRNM